MREKKYLCHVDFFGLYNLYSEKFVNKNLINVFYEILDELNIKVIYLAAFNYDFLKFGKTKFTICFMDLATFLGISLQSILQSP